MTQMVMANKFYESDSRISILSLNINKSQQINKIQLSICKLPKSNL